MKRFIWAVLLFLMVALYACGGDIGGVAGGDVGGGTDGVVDTGTGGDTGGDIGGGIEGGIEGIIDLSINASATFSGMSSGDYIGASIARVGDVNGDGYDDILVSASGVNIGGLIGAGETYLFYGKQNMAVGPWSLDLADVTFAGKGLFDASGSEFSGAGDVNGDGYDDILISAASASVGGDSSAGEIYLVFGSNSLPSTFQLDLANVTFTGRAPMYYTGTAVSGAGDVNGDGYDDILIGTSHADPSGRADAGETYLVYGSNSLLDTVVLDSADATFIGKVARDNSGSALSSAGDINNDGYADFLIGANGADPAGVGVAGETYLIYGQPAKYAGIIDLTGANATFTGKENSDYSGRSVSGAGDVNGDGYDDILIGAHWADPSGISTAGETYLVYGKAAKHSGMINLIDADVTYTGKASGDQSGTAVSSAGDVDGDGFSDILIGASSADPESRLSAGEAYLNYGSDNLSGTYSLDDAFATFQGKSANDYLGAFLTGVGDVNGDGYDDLLISAYGADPNAQSFAGEAYLILGQP